MACVSNWAGSSANGTRVVAPLKLAFAPSVRPATVYGAVPVAPVTSSLHSMSTASSLPSTSASAVAVATRRGGSASRVRPGCATCAGSSPETSRIGSAPLA